MQAAVSPRSCLVWQLIHLASKTLLFFFFFLSFSSSACRVPPQRRFSSPYGTSKSGQTKEDARVKARERSKSSNPIPRAKNLNLRTECRTDGVKCGFNPAPLLLLVQMWGACTSYTCGWRVQCTLVGGVYSVHLWVACTLYTCGCRVDRTLLSWKELNEPGGN